jgi:hypothetical protein
MKEHVYIFSILCEFYFLGVPHILWTRLTSICELHVCVFYSSKFTVYLQEWHIIFISLKCCVPGLRRQSIAKLHNLSIEAPITKVIALITSVQENANAEDIQTLDKVLML